MTSDQPKARTVQVGDRLVILNGRDPLMYVDLTKKKLRKYRPPFSFRIKTGLFRAIRPYSIVVRYERNDKRKET